MKNILFYILFLCTCPLFGQVHINYPNTQLEYKSIFQGSDTSVRLIKYCSPKNPISLSLPSKDFMVLKDSVNFWNVSASEKFDNGKITERVSSYSHEQPKNYELFRYDVSGRISEIELFQDALSVELYRFSYLKNKVIVKIQRNKSYAGKKEYSYNSKGVLLEELHFSKDSMITSRIKYFYQTKSIPKGLKTEENMFIVCINWNCDMNELEEVTYSSNSNKIELVNEFQFKYNDKRLISKTLKSEKAIKNITTYVYSKNGHLSEMVILRPDELRLDFEKIRIE